MAIPRDDIGGLLARAYREIEDLKRRERGRSREGKVVAANPATGLYRVRLREASGGRPAFDSPWMQVEALSAGKLRMQGEPIIGQTVVVRSESGDLTDGIISLSSWSDEHRRPHEKAGELVIDVGETTRITVTADELILSSNGSTLTIDATGIFMETDGTVAIESPSHTHNGTDVGDTHTHGGVDSGPSNTDTPN